MTDRFIQIVRALYYKHGFDRPFPGKDQVINWVDDWERRHQRGDAPKATDAWDQQYASGEWDYMGRLEESSRYAVIVGYLSYLARGGAILDVGCGDGVLFHRVRPNGYSRYVGVDISDVAIRSLSSHQDERTTFLQGDGDSFVPDGTFDAIVFNESLYYFRDPVQAVRRFATHLNPNGVLVASLYQESKRSLAITTALRKHFKVLDASVVQQGSHTWQCLVIRPTPAEKPAPRRSFQRRAIDQGALMLSSIGSELMNWGLAAGTIA